MEQGQQGLSLSSTWYGWKEYETEEHLQIDRDHNSLSASEVDQFVDSFFNSEHIEDAYHSSEVPPGPSSLITCSGEAMLGASSEIMTMDMEM